MRRRTSVADPVNILSLYSGSGMHDEAVRDDPSCESCMIDTQQQCCPPNARRPSKLESHDPLSGGRTGRNNGTFWTTHERSRSIPGLLTWRRHSVLQPIGAGHEYEIGHDIAPSWIHADGTAEMRAARILAVSLCGVCMTHESSLMNAGGFVRATFERFRGFVCGLLQCLCGNSAGYWSGHRLFWLA